MNPEEILKALSHPARLKFLEWLKSPESHFCQDHPLSMGVCANQFQISGLSQSTVSSHLAVLQADWPDKVKESRAMGVFRTQRGNHRRLP